MSKLSKLKKTSKVFKQAYAALKALQRLGLIRIKELDNVDKTIEVVGAAIKKAATPAKDVIRVVEETRGQVDDIW